MKKCILGIDTSNYRTSIAVVDELGAIILDERLLLRVKKGERGLRQSEALFQHIENLPDLFLSLEKENLEIAAVAVSDRPRPIWDSYMPCFKAGFGVGKAIAHTLKVPLFCFSHQEGHLEAVKFYMDLPEEKTVLAWHLSGGTCELLKADENGIEIIGGSKDISFGQVIDRIGVLFGMSFPAGESMDACAMKERRDHPQSTKVLTKVKTDGLFFNLSGLETQCARIWQENDKIRVALIRETFDKITDTIIEVTKQAVAEHEITDVIFAGGVSASQYISREINTAFAGDTVNIRFGRPELSGDNAVGTALLGGKKLWR